MKKFVALLLVMVIVLASCGKPADESANETSQKQEQTTKMESPNKINIAILTSPNGVDDGSFNQNNYEGILSFIAKNSDCTVTAVKEESGAPEAAIDALNEIVADYDVFVLPGFQFAGVSTVALDNPDKKFILIDAAPMEVDGQAEFENVLAYLFNEHESGFLAGIAAALETKTNKVAVVNGIAFPSNVNYQYGFTAGVNYANKYYGTNVEPVELPSRAGMDVREAIVGGNYIGGFDDIAGGKAIGEELLAEGVDIMLVACGNSGNGTFTAIKEAGADKYAIGCDVDQYDDGVNGDSNIIKTSALKKMDINVERALQSIMDGTFKGETIYLGADSDSTGLVIEEGRNQLSPKTIEKVNEAYEKIKSGEIIPPSNFNNTPDDFVGL